MSQCSKQGHIAVVCHSVPGNKKNPIQSVSDAHCLKDEQRKGGDSIDKEFNIPWLQIFKCETNANPSIMIQVQIEGKPGDRELDTGSSISVIPLSVYETHCKHLKMQSTNPRLRTYGNERITPVRTVTATVRYGNQSCEAQMYVVKGQI